MPGSRAKVSRTSRKRRRVTRGPRCSWPFWTVARHPGSFRLRVDWFQRDGSSVFGARRTGTMLAASAGRSLVLDPLYSALEAIDAVNAVTGDPTPTGLDRRMAAYAAF